MKKVLFVCLGNICRSPSAQGILEWFIERRGLSNQYLVDSAGTADYHIGKPPDTRAINACAKLDVDISAQRARQVTILDLSQFDHIIPMDGRNHDFLNQMGTNNQHKIKPLVNYLPYNQLLGIPDPFHGNEDDFDTMVQLLLVACRHALSEIENHHVLQAS
jgi:protein-tyrosine phosphatase